MSGELYTSDEKDTLFRAQIRALNGGETVGAELIRLRKENADMRKRLAEEVELAENITMSRMESEIIALNLKLDMTRKRLAFAVHLLNETNRVATKMKCWEFPASLKIDIRQFLGKDITPCEGGAQ